MSSWTLDPTTKTWSRALGHQEAGFVYDGLFEGTADLIGHLVLDVHDSPSRPASSIFEEAHVRQTWLRWKNRYPLSAARVSTNPKRSLGLEFIIEHQRLERSEHWEVVFHDFSSESEVVQLLSKLQRGPRVLSTSLLARLDVVSLRSSNSVDNAATGCMARYHLLASFAHCITDGASSVAAMKTFLYYLIDPTLDSGLEPIQARLALLPSVDDLNIPPSWSRARKRWKLAIAKILMHRRETRVVGGHTLPTLPPASQLKPALSSTFFLTLSPSISALISRTCRENSITLNSALYVLSQVSLSRLLFRSLERGELTEGEWQSRGKEGMHFGGPVNPRPLFGAVGGEGRDEWAKNGGPSELFGAITYAWCSLPFMPAPAVPSLNHKESIAWSSILSKKRFLNRCTITRQQISSRISHPLFFEISHLVDQRAHSNKAEIINTWEAIQSGINKDGGERNAKGFGASSTAGVVYTNGGSSLGVLDRVLVQSYPQGVKDPRIIVKSYTPHLRCRPRELYLFTYSYGGVIRFGCYWDENVFEAQVVKEWVHGVAEAAEWYLGGAENRDAKVHL